MRVFVAHSSDDAHVSEGIAVGLRQQGHDVFLDEDDLPKGESYDERIHRAIVASDLFVFVISPQSVADGRYTRTELIFARDRWPNPTGHVLPVMVRDTPKETIPPYLLRVSILRPEGDAVAEVVREVARLNTRARGRPRLLAVLIILTAIAGGAVAYFALYSQRGTPSASPEGEASPEPVANEVMLVNAQTGKCVTIAGGVSTDNNVEAVQFNCDSDPSRRWTLNEKTGGRYQIRNVLTNKCLTIAGGVSTDNNVPALQYDCDTHPSRTWRIDDMTRGLFQIRNVQTNKCLTIAGGVSTENNVVALQFDCDNDLSRYWEIRQ